MLSFKAELERANKEHSGRLVLLEQRLATYVKAAATTSLGDSSSTVVANNQNAVAATQAPPGRQKADATQSTQKTTTALPPPAATKEPAVVEVAKAVALPKKARTREEITAEKKKKQEEEKAAAVAKLQEEASCCSIINFLHIWLSSWAFLWQPEPDVCASAILRGALICERPFASSSSSLPMNYEEVRVPPFIHPTGRCRRRSVRQARGGRPDQATSNAARAFRRQDPSREVRQRVEGSWGGRG